MQTASHWYTEERKSNVHKREFGLNLTAVLCGTLCCLRVCARASLSSVGVTPTASQKCLVMELS